MPLSKYEGKIPDQGGEKGERLIFSIRQASLDAFWSREPGTLRGDFTMLRNMGTMDREDLGLEDWFPSLGPYPLKDEVLVGEACVVLMMVLRKGRYVGNLKWDITSKVPTDWANVYESGWLGMVYTINTRYE